jgi:cation:H+ antiporter
MPLLVGAGVLIVTGAKGIAASLGLDPFVIGATIVAVGTSAPELATTLVAKVRGHDEIGLGNILGSNIFNGLFVIALAATIRPIVVDWRETTTALAFGLAALLLVLPRRDGMIPRRRGVLLLVLYGAYVAAVVVLRPSG